MLKKYNWTGYFVYTLILLCYIIWSNQLLIFLNEKGQKTFNPLLFMGWSVLIFIILGVLLGLERLLLEWKKEGAWRINSPKIIMLVTPSLYFSLSIFIYYCPDSFIQNALSYSVSIFLENNISYVFINNVILVTTMYPNTKPCQFPLNPGDYHKTLAESP